MFLSKSERLRAFQSVDIYPVITESLCAGRRGEDVCAQVLAGGARVVQLREKDQPKLLLYHRAEKFRQLTAAAGALLIINDHLDIALGVEADGVHLGQEDFPLGRARDLARELVIGVSTHTAEEAQRAQSAGADYINIGPVFPTQSKSGQAVFLGPEAIPAIQALVRIPVTVMGGIGPGNLKQVLQFGADKVAMITGITQAEDVEQRVRDLRECMEMFRIQHPDACG